MVVRHLIDVDHVKDGRIQDPEVVRHGSIRAGQVEALAGRVDLKKHLNPSVDHDLERCLVVEDLEVGAPVLREGDSWKWASLHR